jgi:DNA-binding NtrC family response regulator/tetratricopeptide (TPR) repeat protein
MVNSLAVVEALTTEGRFEGAFQKLCETYPRWSSAHEVSTRLAALELLERTGRISAARNMLASFKPGSQLVPEAQARLSILRGLLAKHLGHAREAGNCFLLACQIAEKSGLLEALCWAQLRLLGVALDATERDRIPALRMELRRNVERAGLPSVLTAFHIFTAEHEAKHGQLSSSKSHGQLAESILHRHPNVWLSGLLNLQKSCLCYLEGDFTLALKSAQIALVQSADSGHLQTKLLALGDMAAAYLAAGQPARAIRCVNYAMASANPEEQVFGLLLETLAESQLESRDLEGCAESLVRAESLASDLHQSRPAWYRNWNLRTKVRLLQRRGEWGACLAILEDAARSIGSSFSDSQIQLLEALALARTGEPSAASQLLYRVFSRPMDASPLLQGLAHTAVAEWLASGGHRRLALNQYSRSLRILALTGECSGLVEAVDKYVDGSKRSDTVLKNGEPADKGVIIWRPIHVKCHLERATELNGDRGTGLVEFAAFVGCAVDMASEPQALGEESLRTLSALGWIEGGCIERDLLEDDAASMASRCDRVVTTSSLFGEEDCRALLVPLGRKAGESFSLRILPNRDAESTLGCLSAVRLVHSIVRMEREREQPQACLSPSPEVQSVGGKPSVFLSPAMNSLVVAARRIASQDITVLLTGESGTGKEVVANLIHEAAGPAVRPLVVFNCATVPTDMIESQLFGYRRGAFTGATDSFQGLIRAADGGTLFLDEVGELPLATQPKLLRFLDAREVQPLGEAAPHRVRVRVIAATNADLEQRVRDGRFRVDLFYRLNVVHFKLPPLRERREEIRALAETFLARALEEAGKVGVTFSEDAFQHLLLHPWPGNVRQLLHEVRRIAALAEPGQVVRADDLSPAWLQSLQPQQPQDRCDENTISVRLDRRLDDVIKEVEVASLRNALAASRWKGQEAARRLGLSRKGLYLKRRRLGIGDPQK